MVIGTSIRSPQGAPRRDQGTTTGTRCLVVDGELSVLGQGYREICQHFPEPGWVEHHPEEIWESVLVTAEEALTKARIGPSRRCADLDPLRKDWRDALRRARLHD